MVVVIRLLIVYSSPHSFLIRFCADRCAYTNGRNNVCECCIDGKVMGKQVGNICGVHYFCHPVCT